MPIAFLHLPPEILVHVLCHLNLPDVLSCTLTHSVLHALTRDFGILQYHVASQVAKVEDNPGCDISVADRLALLKSREKGWERLESDFRKTVSVQHNPSGIYDLTGGVYLLGDRNRRALYYCILPSSPTDDLKWSKLHVNHNLIDMGLAIYEHDLIAIVTSVPKQKTESLHVIEIELRQFSTGQPHPLARQHTFTVQDSIWPRPAIGIEIVGDHLALVITDYLNPSPDIFYLFDWKQGTAKMCIPFPHHTYAGVIFLSPEIILLPNMQQECFDLWRVPQAGENAPEIPVAALGLPSLVLEQYITSISCRGEPNPALLSTPYTSQPFQPRAADAILIFNIHVQPFATPLGGRTLSLFVHRSTLLDLLPALPATPVVPSELEEGNLDFDPSDMFTLVPWEEWGPPVTRVLEADDVTTRWITTSAGQRCVVTTEIGAHAPLITVLDFNPTTVRNAVARGSRSGDVQAVVEASTISDRAFMMPIISSLPYTMYTSMDLPAYDGVLMDEERLLGIRTNDNDNIYEFEVIHIGSNSSN